MTTLVIALDAKDAHLIVSEQGVVATWEYGVDFSTELLQAIEKVVTTGLALERIAVAYTQTRSGVIRTAVVVSSLYAHAKSIPLIEIPYAADPAVLIATADRGQPINVIQPHYDGQGK